MTNDGFARHNNGQHFIQEEAMLRLSDVSIGEVVKVCGFHPGQSHYRQKLLAMGLTPNTEFQVIRRAPFGDPIEIRVRNFYLSLRQEETALLKLKRVTNE